MISTKGVCSGFRDYNIDRFDLQRLKQKERKTWFTGSRDHNWHKQITNYMEEKPYDEVLVIAGLRHVSRWRKTR